VAVGRPGPAAEPRGQAAGLAAGTTGRGDSRGSAAGAEGGGNHGRRRTPGWPGRVSVRMSRKGQLGVKGDLSGTELMTSRCRMHDGRWAKARRGELIGSLPVGYVRTESGTVVFHPDQQVQARLRYVFELFAELRVARRVVARLRREKLKLPAQVW